MQLSSGIQFDTTNCRTAVSLDTAMLWCAVCNIIKSRYTVLKQTTANSSFSIRLREKGNYFFWDTRGTRPVPDYWSVLYLHMLDQQYIRQGLSCSCRAKTRPEDAQPNRKPLRPVLAGVCLWHLDRCACHLTAMNGAVVNVSRSFV